MWTILNHNRRKAMTDLTEQWKKGELPEGVYYCNTGYTVEILFTWGKNYHQLTNNKDEVYIPEMDDCEILAPVPSYGEWQASYNCMLENEVLRLKNAQLKELLKESKVYVENFIEGSTIINDHHISYILLQRINEVLK